MFCHKVEVFVHVQSQYLTCIEIRVSKVTMQ